MQSVLELYIMPNSIIDSGDALEEELNRYLYLKSSKFADIMSGYTQSCCVYVQNRKGQYVYCNDNYCKVLEVPREKLIGSTDDDFSPVFSQIDESSEVYTTIFNDDPSGKEQWVKTTKTLIHGFNGDVIGALVVSSIISNIKTNIPINSRVRKVIEVLGGANKTAVATTSH